MVLFLCCKSREHQQYVISDYKLFVVRPEMDSQGWCERPMERDESGVTGVMNTLKARSACFVYRREVTSGESLYERRKRLKEIRHCFVKVTIRSVGKGGMSEPRFRIRKTSTRFRIDSILDRIVTSCHFVRTAVTRCSREGTLSSGRGLSCIVKKRNVGKFRRYSVLSKQQQRLE